MASREPDARPKDGHLASALHAEPRRARVLVTGAYGFIGAHIVRALQVEGVDVVGAGRDLRLGRRLLPDIAWIACDFNEDLAPGAWPSRLVGIDAVVNTVGILQSTARDDANRIHAVATSALFEACRRAGVKRLVHVSAMSGETGVATGYAASKLAAEAALEALDVNRAGVALQQPAPPPLAWVIVKPSLVVGAGSYGGTSLIRGLAGLPGLIPVPAPGTATLQPIAMADLATGIARLASGFAGNQPWPNRQTLYAAGPERLTVAQIVPRVRRWLVFGSARVVLVPRVLMTPALWLGDWLGWLGTPSALRSTALQQLDGMSDADPAPFAAATGLALKRLEQALGQHAATLQDRQHARLFFVRPLLQGSIALFWIATGVMALLPGPAASARALITAAGFDDTLAGWCVRLGALADMGLGLAFLNAAWTRPAGLLQIALSLGYLGAITAINPGLWLDPLGPLMKVLPIVAAIVTVMALAEKR